MSEGDSRAGVTGASAEGNASGAGVDAANRSGTDYILRLGEVDRSSGPIVGGKAVNLGELIRLGFPVPQGFVITAKAFNRFLDSGSLKARISRILSTVNIEEDKSLQSASADIINMIMGLHMPDLIRSEVRDAYEELSIGRDIKDVGGAALDMIKAGRGQTFVAVRNSLVYSGPGSERMPVRLGSRLCVEGNEALYDAIKQCWASLFSTHAIFSMKSSGLSADYFSMLGVVVQKMIDSEKSGVLLTADPTGISNSSDQHMIVEAAWGYGDAIATGLVTPDEYIISKETGTTENKSIRNKKWRRKLNPISGNVETENVDRAKANSEVLADSEMIKLLDMGRRVEDHWSVPQRIEWVSEKGRLYLVQTDPIPNQKDISYSFDGSQQDAQQAHQEVDGKVLLKGNGVSPGIASGTVNIINGHDEMDRLENGNILVTGILAPDMTPKIRKASAIITNYGGKACFAALVSRDIGIPCIVGTDLATSVLSNGQKITVDAGSGNIHEFIESEETAEPKPGEPQSSGIESPKPIEPAPTANTKTASYAISLPSMTVSSEKLTATGIKVNISFPQSIDNNHDMISKSDGAGLVRAEHILTETGKHPVIIAKNDPEVLVRSINNGLGKVAKAFYPKPVWYRFLDARTDEFRELEGAEEPDEANPILGWHGARRSISQSDVFRCELKAVKNLHDNGLDNIAVTLPFVSTVDELIKARKMMNDVGLRAKLGIMVETPAAALGIEEFCRQGIGFVSVGYSNLVQLTLGIDRDNTRVSHLYSETDSAVLDLIKYVIKVCKKRNVEVSMCGMSGSSPRMAEMLVSLGIDSISTEPDAIDEIRGTVAKAERRIILQKIGKQ